MEVEEPEERTGEPERFQDSAYRWALRQSSVQKPGHRSGRLALTKALTLPIKAAIRLLCSGEIHEAH